MKNITTFVRVLKDGTKVWCYRLNIASLDGKRSQPSRSGFKTKALAEKAGAQALLEYEVTKKMPAPKNADITYNDFLNLWIEKDCVLDLKESTVKGYQKRIRNYIAPELGAYKLKAIDRITLQGFIVDLFNQGFALNTLISIRGILSKSFSWAVDNGYLENSPATNIKIPKNRAPNVPTREAKSEYISADSMEKIFNRFPERHPSHIPLKIGYECGMRIGEVFALVWEDIDFKNKTITVNRQIQWNEDKERTTKEKLQANGSAECGNGYWYFTNPKYNSFRVIDMSESLALLLEREYKRQQIMRSYYEEQYINYYCDRPLNFGGTFNSKNSIANPISATGSNPVNFVCVRENGSYISSRTMTNTSRVIKSIIPENFKYHDLRHTHISMLYENGVNEKYIQERTGHKDYRMTREYICFSEVSRAQGIAAINALFPSFTQPE